MNIGENIKTKRKLKGLTQNDLAKKANLSKNAIYNYENNKRNPSIDIIRKIAEALEVPIYELTGEIDISNLVGTISSFEVKNKILANAFRSIYEEDNIKQKQELNIDILEEIVLGFNELEASFNKFKEDYIVGIKDFIDINKENKNDNSYASLLKHGIPKGMHNKPNKK